MSQLPVMTVAQAAKAVGVSEDTMRRWCEAGTVASTTLGGRTAVMRTAVTEFSQRYIRSLGAADALRIDVNMVYDLVQRGRLRGERMGSVLMITRASLDALLQTWEPPQPRRAKRHNGPNTIVPMSDEARRQRLREVMNRASTAVVLDAHGNKIGEIERE